MAKRPHGDVAGDWSPSPDEPTAETEETDMCECAYVPGDSGHELHCPARYADDDMAESDPRWNCAVCGNRECGEN